MSKATEVAHLKRNHYRKPSHFGTWPLRAENVSFKEHQGCVLPLNQHKDKRRFFLVSNMLILSFISGAEMAKWCISTTSPVTQLPTYIARPCVLQQCQPPMSPPVAVTHVRRRWSHNLTGQTQNSSLKFIKVDSWWRKRRRWGLPSAGEQLLQLRDICLAGFILSFVDLWGHWPFLMLMLTPWLFFSFPFPFTSCRMFPQKWCDI